MLFIITDKSVKPKSNIYALGLASRTSLISCTEDPLWPFEGEAVGRWDSCSRSSMFRVTQVLLLKSIWHSEVITFRNNTRLLGKTFLNELVYRRRDHFWHMGLNILFSLSFLKKTGNCGGFLCGLKGSRPHPS